MIQKGGNIMGLLSKRCLKYIRETIEAYLEKSELIIVPNTNRASYDKGVKKVRKMCNEIEDKPEKYLDENYITPEIAERLESEADEYYSKINRY